MECINKGKPRKSFFSDSSAKSLNNNVG
uniref:Uncharacterized protein n=1 Tax=Anguilla anguilla TaxID=7936 RepID=A0A0E9RVJ3_ANGAN